jgi:hypothetical protein
MSEKRVGFALRAKSNLEVNTPLPNANENSPSILRAVSTSIYTDRHSPAPRLSLPTRPTRKDVEYSEKNKRRPMSAGGTIDNGIRKEHKSSPIVALKRRPASPKKIAPTLETKPNQMKAYSYHSFTAFSSERPSLKIPKQHSMISFRKKYSSTSAILENIKFDIPLPRTA